MLADLQVQYDTGHIFNGWNVQDIWHKEDQAWLRRTAKYTDSFPPLQECLKGPSPLLKRPAICQDVFWSSDGLSFVTRHDDYGIRQYLIPEVEETSCESLIPFTRMFKSHSIVSSDVHPKYSLYNGVSQFNVILIASKELPLQLYSLESSDQQCLFRFNTDNLNSGDWEVPYTMDWANDDQFLTGSLRNKVSLFDIRRRKPIWISQSTRSRSVSKSIVSCFDQQGSQEFADNRNRVFGTYRNELYFMDCRTQRTSLLHRSLVGSGFIQLLKSVNGHYLFVIKRNSDAIEVLDTRNSYLEVSQLKLPFKVGNQKYKASLTPTNGLTIGTNHGSIINWSSSLVEFGGIDRYTFSESDDAQEICPEFEYKTPYSSSRINIVEQCPTEPDLFITSHSPDKMADDPDKNAASGISIVKLFTT